MKLNKGNIFEAIENIDKRPINEWGDKYREHPEQDSIAVMPVSFVGAIEAVERWRAEANKRIEERRKIALDSVDAHIEDRFKHMTKEEAKFNRAEKFTLDESLSPMVISEAIKTDTSVIYEVAKDIISNKKEYSHKCDDKTLATLFFEPSTRTRLSFEAAMLELGGRTLGFSEAASSSAAKGETVSDTIRVVGCYSDIIAMRHPKEGAPLVASLKSTVPIINAGDGGHNHPTQTLTDLLTIDIEKGRLDNLTIGLCGDLKFGRTVHSLITAMSRYKNIKLVLISPKELEIPEYVKRDIIEKNNMQYVETKDIEEYMGDLDILYMTRVQKERFFNEEDYVRLKDYYILNKEKLEKAKKDLSILHPLPRVNEISVDVDDDPRACYFKQALNGKFIRMALILKLLNIK